MEKKAILVVDDEKNIRLTLFQSLEPLGIPVQTAANGEEALQKLREGQFGLVFLDLKMPGMDGMDVLRLIKDDWPSVRVIIITAYGTIESAVEAMKLGAVDFVQKPFSPGEIRDLATLVLEREATDEATTMDYPAWIELTKRHITDKNLAAARESISQAIVADPGQPEAYNLLGKLLEIKGDLLTAQKFYRAALDIESERIVTQTEHDSRNAQTGKSLRYLLCDLSGRFEPESEGEECVRSTTQCLDRAVEGTPGIIVVRFGPMLIQQRDALVKLCVALKGNTQTRKSPLLALLHEKHRGLIENLKRAGVDFVKFIAETRLTSSLIIETIDGLSTDDRVERQFTMLCPYLHYDAIDASHEMTVCGAYLDRMVLGGKWLHEVCETENHLSCKYFLNPRSKS
ncbi:MAG: response regulator [Syntrophobacteraceae bacterium]|nr:response regulator [Syntrophobacteraceae bacterium]